uniref:Uncharacterized protein n=1 Tax=Ceratitis capitata TaxID=7213 RepID=W8AP17_CERCA
MLSQQLIQQQQQQMQQTANSSADERSNNTNAVPEPTNNRNHHQHTAGPIRSVSHTAVTSASNANYTRNSLPSNIPTRRPNSLQLRKTTNNQTTVANNRNNNSNVNQMAHLNNKNKIINATNGVLKAANAVKQKIELFIDTSTSAAGRVEKSTPPATTQAMAQNKNNDQQQHQKQPRVETKLERSSTFCKETSDMDINELQIIE